MTAALEPMPQSDLSLVSAASAQAAAVRTSLAPLLPPLTIGIGLVFTIGWIGTLLWLFLRMFLAFG
jgi:hypothetical protein